jgi:hypothetical protein
MDRVFTGGHQRPLNNWSTTMDRAQQSERVKDWRIAQEAAAALLELVDVKAPVIPQGIHQTALQVGRRGDGSVKRRRLIQWAERTALRLEQYDPHLAQEFRELPPSTLSNAGTETVNAALQSYERMLRFLTGGMKA